MSTCRTGGSLVAALAVALGLCPFLAAAADTAPAQTAAAPASDGDEDVRVAQFTLPSARPAPGAGPPPPPVPQFLEFQYFYTGELKFTYVNNLDLQYGLTDRDVSTTPLLTGGITYRPTDWLETRLDVSLERKFGLKQEKVTILPDALDEPVYRSQNRDNRRDYRLFAEQAFAKVKPPGLPIEFMAGRQTYADRRLWLYDANLDTAHVRIKPGDFHIDAFTGKENLVDLDATSRVPHGRIDYHALHVEYRGIEDHQFAAYSILRRDERALSSPDYTGRPNFFGLRALGRPSDNLNYWADIGWVRGRAGRDLNADEFGDKIEGFGYDVGATYRFLSLPLQPSITLGYAFGSGDRNVAAGDTTAKSFMQTGLQTNEGKFGGVTQFRTYGEFFDPQLRNIEIFTVGVGARPAAWLFTELVFHQYRMDEPVPTEIFAGAAPTAPINKIDRLPNRRTTTDLGREIDIVIGLRNLFGIRGFGTDVRAGLFFPGDAYDIENPAGQSGRFLKNADRGVSLIFLFLI
jgi:alginate production protein